MANKIDTVERDRRLVHVYDNGMERDAGTGQIVKPPAGKLLRPNPPSQPDVDAKKNLAM